MAVGFKNFFLELINQFNSHSITYAVMRNYQPLPDSTAGSDIDLLFTETEKEQAIKCVYIAAKKTNAVVWGQSDSVQFSKVFILGQPDSTDMKWWGCCLDLNFGLCFRGMPYLYEEFGSLRQLFKGFQVLKKGPAAVLGIIKELLNNDHLPEKYLMDAVNFHKIERQTVQSMLAPMGDAFFDLYESLLFDPEFNIELGTNKFRNIFTSSVLRKKPWAYFRCSVTNLSYKFLRYLRPSGKIVAFLGVDGAGKSTVINAIKPILDEVTHNTVTIKHLRPGLLPPLSDLANKLRRKEPKNKMTFTPVVQPHAAKPSGTLGSLFRVFYLLLDYTVGYWLYSRVFIAKQPGLVIFDRFADDIYLDPARFRISLNKNILATLVRFTPRPDYIFCLFGAPLLIHDRKKELPLTEVVRQIDALVEYSRQNSNSILIDTTQGNILDTRDIVLNALSKLPSKTSDTI